MFPIYYTTQLIIGELKADMQQTCQSGVMFGHLLRITASI